MLLKQMYIILKPQFFVIFVLKFTTKEFQTFSISQLHTIEVQSDYSLQTTIYYYLFIDF